MFKNPFLIRKQTLETRLIPAQENQSRCMIGYKAVQRWHGQWDLYFCDYIPADQVARMQKKHREAIGTQSFALPLKDGSTGDFRCLERIFMRGLTDAAVREFISEYDAKGGLQHTTLQRQRISQMLARR